MGDITTHYGQIRLPRPTLFDPFILTRSESPKKKKKEWKGFDQVKLWVWPKSQNFQNGPIPLSFSSTFQFWDPFLYPRLGNCTNGSISKNLTFAWILTKSQNFQNGPVPLSFLSTFWFWDPFLHSRLGNCANCPISRKLTFAQILTKSQNFQEGLVPHNFSCRFRFWGLFLHSTIQNCSNRCDSTAIGFNVNFDQESRCSSKACSIQIFT